VSTIIAHCATSPDNPSVVPGEHAPAGDGPFDVEVDL